MTRPVCRVADPPASSRSRRFPAAASFQSCRCSIVCRLERPAAAFGTRPHVWSSGRGVARGARCLRGATCWPAGVDVAAGLDWTATWPGWPGARVAVRTAMLRRCQHPAGRVVRGHVGRARAASMTRRDHQRSPRPPTIVREPKMSIFRALRGARVVHRARHAPRSDTRLDGELVGTSYIVRSNAQPAMRVAARTCRQIVPVRSIALPAMRVVHGCADLDRCLQVESSGWVVGSCMHAGVHVCMSIHACTLACMCACRSSQKNDREERSRSLYMYASSVQK